MEFEFHPEARSEYLAAATFYESRKAGLGGHFTIEVEDAISMIIEAPLRWPVFEGEIRRCLTHRFPYGILYSVEEKSVLVLAVMHCAREPGYWKNRLTR